MATRAKTLRTRWSLDAAEDISSVGSVVQLEDTIVASLKDRAWAATDLHRDFDAYESYDDWQRA